MLNRMVKCIVFLASGLASCSSPLTNSVNEMELICGTGYDSSKSYVLIEDFDTTQARSADLSVALTSRGCIERPSSNSLFVVSEDKTKGIWISPSSERSVRLESFGETTTPSKCSASINLVSKELTVEVDSSTGWNFAYPLQVETTLFQSDSNGKLVEWQSQDLEPRIRYSLSNLSLKLGDYPIAMIVIDSVKGVKSKLECKLRIDPSALVIYPADKIKNQRVFADKIFNVVEPGYQPSFYIQDGFRDVSIDYCIDRIDLKLLGDLSTAPEPCESPINYLNSTSNPLDEGIWLIRFRGKRASVETEWQQSLIMVERICEGNFENSSELANLWCTGLRGSLKVERWAAGSFPYLGFVHGKVTVVNPMASDSFSNLVEVVGLLDIRYDDNLLSPGAKVSGFNKLERVVGDLSISGFVDEKIEGFNSLTTITGKVTFDRLRNLNAVDGFGRLKAVNSLEILSLPRLTDLKAFSSLERVSSLYLSECPSLSRIGGTQLKEVASIRLENSGLQYFGSDIGPLQIKDSLILERSSPQKFYGIEPDDNVSLILRDYSVPHVEIEGLASIRSLAIDGSDSRIENLNLVGIKDLDEVAIKGTKSVTFEGLDSLERLKSLWVENSSIISMPSIGNDLKINQAVFLNCPGLRSIGNIRSLTIDELNFSDLDNFESLNGLENLDITNFFAMHVDRSSFPKFGNFDALRSFKTNSEITLQVENCLLEESAKNAAQEFIEYNRMLGQTPTLILEFPKAPCKGSQTFR